MQYENYSDSMLENMANGIRKRIISAAEKNAYAIKLCAAETPEM